MGRGGRGGGRELTSKSSISSLGAKPAISLSFINMSVGLPLTFTKSRPTYLITMSKELMSRDTIISHSNETLNLAKHQKILEDAGG